MPASQSLITRMLVQTVIWLAITGALLFVSAGTCAGLRPGFSSPSSAASVSYPALSSPSAIRLCCASVCGPSRRSQKSWDKALISIFFALWMSQYVLIGLDAVRFHWSDVPLWLQVAAPSASPSASTPATWS